MISRRVFGSLVIAAALVAGGLGIERAQAATVAGLAGDILLASQSATDPAGQIQIAIGASGLSPEDVARALGLAEAMGADAALIAQALSSLIAANPGLADALQAAYEQGKAGDGGGFGGGSSGGGGFQGDAGGTGGGQDNPSPN